MSNQDRELLADLKQDASNSTKSNESQATKEHIAGAQGKLASAISQARGDSDLNSGGRQLARETQPSNDEIDRDQIQKDLYARAEEKIKEQTGYEASNMQRGTEGMNMEKGSEAARLQSAAEQYDLAREGRQEAPEQGQ